MLSELRQRLMATAWAPFVSYTLGVTRSRWDQVHEPVAERHVLYILRRDVVLDRFWTGWPCPLRVRDMFLCALWRDVVLDVPGYIEVDAENPKFLYALRRDMVLDIAVSTPKTATPKTAMRRFLYALRGDVALDLRARTGVGPPLVSIRPSA